MLQVRSPKLMNNRRKFVVASILLPLLAGGHGLAQTAAPPRPIAGNCEMQLGGPAIFCDTFDIKKDPTIQSRTGDLDPNVWGVSRTIGDVNLGQGQYNAAPSTAIRSCDGTNVTVRPPNDVIICDGQLREATNDNPANIYDAGGVTSLAMYPKQPFDFAGRTGTVAFDIANDTHGFHAAWPEFWMSNLPTPVPFEHLDSWVSNPQHGFGMRFSAQVGPGQRGLCPNGKNLTKPRWTVNDIVVVRNYVYEDAYYNTVNGTPSTPPLKLNILDCVVSSPDNSGIMNHIEVRVSQSLIEVWASDAGTTALRKIATATNANLSFTRGLIWLEDVHYNADKGESGSTVPSQRQHTFVWDNVAFDGPFTYRDFSYDALDANQPGPANNAWNLGKLSSPDQTSSWSVLYLPANPQAEVVRVLFNFHNETNRPPTVLNVNVNGNVHSVPWPYPDQKTNTWRTFAVTVPTADLVTGNNLVQIGSNEYQITSNVNIVLVNVPGGVPVLPGSNNSYPIK